MAPLLACRKRIFTTHRTAGFQKGFPLSDQGELPHQMSILYPNRSHIFCPGATAGKRSRLSRLAVEKQRQNVQAAVPVSAEFQDRRNTMTKDDVTQLPRDLSAAQICSHLGAHPWAGLVQVLQTVDSTNSLAKHLAAEGAPEGTVILAEHQSGGRGRMGRSFSSPEGSGIYMSVILRPGVSPAQLLHLTAAVAVAACDAVERATGLRPQIKWVNDLIAGGRKLAGILTELSVELETGLTQYAVVGVGINCCQAAFPPELQQIATSLYQQTGCYPDRSCLAAELICSLQQLSATVLTQQDNWMARYSADCLTVGQPVQVLRAGEVRQAVALGVDREAALQVRYPDGSCERVACGEVSVRGLYGYV